MSEPRAQGNSVEYVCHNCGVFRLSGTADAIVEKAGFSPSERARLSYGLRRMGGGMLLSSHLLESILQDTQLPDAHALLDNLLLHMANELAGPGESMELWALGMRAWLGALSSASVRWAIDQALSAELLEGVAVRTILGDEDFRLLNATLTVKGWARVEELLRSANGSRKGFMAMKFGDSQLDAVFRQYFKPAVHKAGFDLVRLDDEPRAGLIDDRLRLEIRTSRFLVADLSHANAGAYWEAGFAEGLGRPVIYTCRKDVFDNPATKPHFDTNHHLTVVWDPADAAAAAEQLKTVIRVTLPTEAKLEDSP
ncbi:MAG: hypothetical protein HY068_02350 [Burkholderiales bacterium]|nr:hypothetical protein [Burkholderiales bacterium]